MNGRWLWCFVTLALAGFLGTASLATAQEPGSPLRAGIIGLDTSHAGAFTKTLNGPRPDGKTAVIRVVAAFPGGSPDIPSSIDRVPEYTEQMRQEFGVEIVDSIPRLLEKVDVVLLESVDGRPHLEQARPVIEAGKPLFIDKPFAGSLRDAIQIVELAKKHKVPVFSSSSLRYSPNFLEIKADPSLGKILGCEAFSPCSLEEHHPDLFWYGIHGVETLFTMMGPGCQTVARTSTADTDVVVGTWKDGRVGIFRGLRAGKHDYGVLLFGEKANKYVDGFGGYEPLLDQIETFFKTGASPVPLEETIEILAFMEAAQESKARGGAPVSLAEVMERATPKTGQ